MADRDSLKSPYLRRADWRFLLPRPSGEQFENLVLLGGPDGLGQRLLETGTARRVVESIPDEPSADAVVILDRSISTQHATRAAKSLLPGGAFYWEISRRFPFQRRTSLQVVQNRLRKVGVFPVGTYWAAPGFESCKRYIPLDEPGALRWYFSTLYISGTPWYRLLKTAVHTATGFDSQRFARWIPWYAIVATAGENATSAASIIGHPACPISLGEQVPHPLLLTSGQDDGSRVIVLPFEADTCQPAVVFKVARLPEVNVNVLNEQRVLGELRSHLSEPLRSTIPEPFGTFDYGPLKVGIESCAAGQPISQSSGQWLRPTDAKIRELELVTDWLVEFHRQTRGIRPEQSSDQFLQQIDSLFKDYDESFGTTPNEQKLFSRTLSYERELGEFSLPVVWQHNDFGPWNIYRSDHRITVLDWELGWGPGFDSFGPPLLNLFYFATHWSYDVRHLYGKAAEDRGFHDLFIEVNRRVKTVDAIHKNVERYLASLGVERRLIPVLLIYAWANRAVKRQARQRTLHDLGRSRRANNRFVDYVSHLADHWETLFQRLSVS